MQLKTILNRVQKHRSFVYGPARLVQGAQLTIEVEVHAHSALAPRSDEETRPHAQSPPCGVAELVPGQGAVFKRRCRRIQHKSKTDDEKILRIPDL